MRTRVLMSVHGPDVVGASGAGGHGARPRHRRHRRAAARHARGAAGGRHRAGGARRRPAPTARYELTSAGRRAPTWSSSPRPSFAEAARTVVLDTADADGRRAGAASSSARWRARSASPRRAPSARSGRFRCTWRRSAPRRSQQANPLSTGDALATAANVTPVGNGPFGVRPRLRGLDSTRLLVLVDGERLNTARQATDRTGAEVGLDPHRQRSAASRSSTAPARCSTAPTRWPARSTSSPTSRRFTPTHAVALRLQRLLQLERGRPPRHA